jgi:hypothetical protein
MHNHNCSNDLLTVNVQCKIVTQNGIVDETMITIESVSGFVILHQLAIYFCFYHEECNNDER